LSSLQLPPAMRTDASLWLVDREPPMNLPAINQDATPTSGSWHTTQAQLANSVPKTVGVLQIGHKSSIFHSMLCRIMVVILTLSVILPLSSQILELLFRVRDNQDWTSIDSRFRP
jgi:hypothetical protein